MIYAVMIAIGVGFGFCFYMLSRNARVYRFRMSVISRVSAAAQQDIILGRDWQWRYMKFNSVDYQEMMRPPWKRLTIENYYQDDSFVRVSETP